jgi:predicted nucleic acid-binding protein
MPHVVLDTSVSLPATLSSTGLARKFWLLLAYGALHHQGEQRHAEIDALRSEAQSTGATVAGTGEGVADSEDFEQRLAILRDLLPDDAPTHWLAVGSAPLFDEYERKVRDVGRRLNPAVRESDVAPLRRQMEAICVLGPPPFETAQTPVLTRDRRDDPIVYTALLADADYLVSDDRDIVPNGHEQHYEHDKHHVLAVTFNQLLSNHFEPANLDWGAIDGRWLPHAYPDTSIKIR